MYHLYKHTSGNVSLWREVTPADGSPVKEWEFVSYAMAANAKAVSSYYKDGVRRPAHTFNHEPPVDHTLPTTKEYATCFRGGVIFSSDSLDDISKEVFLLAL